MGLCLPPEDAVVFCVDKKTGIQALDRTAPMLPLMPGAPQRRTRGYRRRGTTDLYAALEVASGKVITDMSARHRSEESRRFLNLIDAEHRTADDIFATLPHISHELATQDPSS